MGCRWLGWVDRLSLALNWPFRPGPGEANAAVVTPSEGGILGLLLQEHHTAGSVVVMGCLFMGDCLIKTVANKK